MIRSSESAIIANVILLANSTLLRVLLLQLQHVTHATCNTCCNYSVFGYNSLI